jgi:peptide/nickel transport system ATP-binding protein/oligopeptide transport system ATP-binding protein
MSEAILSVRGLVKHFRPRARMFGAEAKPVRAVDGIDLDVPAQGTLGLVGESGCGKSTTGRLVLRLIEADAGTIHFEGEDIRTVPAARLRGLRRRMQIVFQDPFASLDPRMTVAEILAEPFVVHGIGDGAARAKSVRRLLDQVGLAAHHAERHPHEFSGGQRQRIGIARALALDPALIVADEPVSALDVSIQAQILNLMRDLQRARGLAFLFISHNLAVVRHMADRMAVMYLGRVVEEAPREALFAAPLHPYTRALLSAVPDPGRGRQERIVLTGEIPRPDDPPSGCRFRTRCPLADAGCASSEPLLSARGGDHRVACHKVP